jgi:hypothetical protein
MKRLFFEKRFWVKVLIVYFTLFSTAGFTSFIAEEAMQCSTFGAFAYQSAKDWDGLESHLVVMKSVHSTGEFCIRYIGWLNPIMYPAYLNYAKANRGYIKAIERRVAIEKEMATQKAAKKATKKAAK